MNKDNLIEFAKEQCEIFPEDSEMGKYLRETLKMLQAEPCEDAVSRSSVFEIMGNLMSIPYDLDRPINKKDVSESMNEIRALPPVIPTQKWIPVSERLPEENGFYLATCDGEICGENEPFTGLAEYENGKWVDDEEDYQCVLAWMPLPPSYRGEEFVSYSQSQINDAEEVKAVPLEKLKDFRNEVMDMNSVAIIQRLDKLIEEVEE